MKIRLPSIAFLLMLASGLEGCASWQPPGPGFALELRAEPLELSAVAGSAEVLFRGGFALEANRPEFGGFSGLLVENGQLVAISDRGYWWQEPLTQSDDGRIQLAPAGKMGPLFDFGGKVTSGSRRDAEEIAAWPGGHLVSFEGEHRVALYQRDPRRAFSRADDLPAVAGARPRRLKVPVELDATYTNGGIEAMTRLLDGRLVLFSEEQRDREGHGLLWVGEPTRGIWRRLKLEIFEDFRPTSAATLPDGDVLLLERSYEESRGVRGRVRRLPAEAFSALPSGPRPPIQGEEILYLEPPEAVDNFEGIEILPMADGRVFFLLLSDDNYSRTQRTLLLQFELLAP